MSERRCSTRRERERERVSTGESESESVNDENRAMVLRRRKIDNAKQRVRQREVGNVCVLKHAKDLS